MATPNTVTLEAIEVAFHNPIRRSTRFRARGTDGLTLDVRLDGPAVAPGETVTASLACPEGNPRGPLRGEIHSVSPPASADALKRYLSSGIAGSALRRMAPGLSARDPAATIAALDNGADAIAAITLDRKSAALAADAWRCRDETKGARLAILCAGVETKTVDRLVRLLGPRLNEILSLNPYELTHYSGMTFAAVDRLALALGRDQQDPLRIQAGVESALVTIENEGATAASANALASRAASLLGIIPAYVNSAVRTLVEKGQLRQINSLGRPAVMRPEVDEQEDRVARALLDRPTRSSNEVEAIVAAAIDASARRDRPLTPDQQNAVATMATYRSVLLIGEPGTGKTTIQRAFADGIDAVYQGYRLLQASPTGRAAKRQAEATGRRAKTMHRAIGFDPESGRPLHHEGNRFGADGVTIDEASMMPLNVADPFFCAKAADLRAKYADVVKCDPPGVSESHLAEERRRHSLAERRAIALKAAADLATMPDRVADLRARVMFEAALTAFDRENLAWQAWVQEEAELAAERHLHARQLAETPDRRADLQLRHGFEAQHASWERELVLWNRTQERRRVAMEELATIPADAAAKAAALDAALAAAIAYEALLREWQTSYAAYSARLAEVQGVEAAATDWDNAKEALIELRARLKAFLAPSLNAAASRLISEMTGGAMSSVMVDDEFDVRVDGVKIAGLSGGEETVANIALRIALGQVLTAGVFPVLLLDEIDAHMDDQRAEYAMRCIVALKASLGQIVVISHKPGAIEADHRISPPLASSTASPAFQRIAPAPKRRSNRTTETAS